MSTQIDRPPEVLDAFFNVPKKAFHRRIVIAITLGGSSALPKRTGDLRPFHVVAKYGREVIDRLRVDEANRLRHDKPT